MQVREKSLDQVIGWTKSKRDARCDVGRLPGCPGQRARHPSIETPCPVSSCQRAPSSYSEIERAVEDVSWPRIGDTVATRPGGAEECSGSGPIDPCEETPNRY